MQCHHLSGSSRGAAQRRLAVSVRLHWLGSLVRDRGGNWRDILGAVYAGPPQPFPPPSPMAQSVLMFPVTCLFLTTNTWPLSPHSDPPACAGPWQHQVINMGCSRARRRGYSESEWPPVRGIDAEQRKANKCVTLFHRAFL